MNSAYQHLFEEHLKNHLTIAMASGSRDYTIPHPNHDHNVHDLFQHGFDMRNPYGSNLEGPWFMVTDEGALLYGHKQEQLVETLLIGDFLKKNVIEISHGAQMEAGWGKVIAKQIALGQTIPPKTLESYTSWQQNQSNAAQSLLPVNTSEITHQYRAEVGQVHQKNIQDNTTEGENEAGFPVTPRNV